MTAMAGDSVRIVDLALARRERGRPAPRGILRPAVAMPVGEAVVDVRPMPRSEWSRPGLAPGAGGVAGGAPAALAHGTPDALRRLAPQRKSAVHLLSLLAVWLAVFAGGFVASEPAPVDVLTMGLVVLLPSVGLTAIGRPQLAYLVLWLAVMAAGVVAAGQAVVDPAAAGIHIGVSVYLCIASFVFAAFVARRPEAHARLVFNAWAVGGVVAALLGIVGYLGLTPGGLFTVHQRATGLFKDPNVYAAFLVAPMVYALHVALTARLARASLALAALAVMALALLMSFSRGAWAAVAVACAAYAWLAFITAPSNRQRARLVLFGAAGAGALVLLVGAALQLDAVARLFDQRASLDQSYDIGPEGRFGGQLKAIEYILENPLGIGALQFGGILHHEQPHNVYLAMFLYTGWLGGAIYLLLVLTTLAWGLRAVLRRKWPSPTLLVAWAAFLGIALEGLVIDSDHWRHFYLLMGLLWGQMFIVEAPRRAVRIRAVLPVPAPVAETPVAAAAQLSLDAVLARIATAPPSRSARIRGAAPAVPRAIIVPRSQRRRRRAPTREARIVTVH